MSDAATPLRVGVIGGSGLYKMDNVKMIGERRVKTPFGDPSDVLKIGRIVGPEGELLDTVELVFLPRHGSGHQFMPTEVNYRANIFAMKSLGVEWIIAVSAVGSLRENIDQGHIVLVDQFIDKCKFRKDSFFGDGCVGHAPFGDPVCNTLRGYLLDSCKELRGTVFPATEGAFTVHNGGTYVNMEGPAFSSRAESMMHRAWGAQVIGMTAVAEAKLCREAEISYAVLAMATDYDAWKEGEHVTVDIVVATINRNVKNAQSVVMKCLPKIVAHKAAGKKHPQDGIMSGAIMTPSELIPPHKKVEMAPIISKYVDCTPVFSFSAYLPEWNTTTALVLGLAAGAGLYALKK